MIKKDIKRVFKVEEKLNIKDFKDKKLDIVSNKFRNIYKKFLVEVTVYVVKDKVLITFVDKKDLDILGTDNNIIDIVLLSPTALLNLDNKMVKTLKIAIVKDSKLDTETKAIDYAQFTANKMFESDNTKIPLITVKDYRGIYQDKLISSTIFGGLLGDVVGNVNSGSEISEEMNIIKFKKDERPFGFTIQYKFKYGIYKNLYDVQRLINNKVLYNKILDNRNIFSIRIDNLTFDFDIKELEYNKKYKPYYVKRQSDLLRLGFKENSKNIKFVNKQDYNGTLLYKFDILINNKVVAKFDITKD